MSDFENVISIAKTPQLFIGDSTKKKFLQLSWEQLIPPKKEN